MSQAERKSKVYEDSKYRVHYDFDAVAYLLRKRSSKSLVISEMARLL